MSGNQEAAVQPSQPERELVRAEAMLRLYPPISDEAIRRLACRLRALRT